MAFPKPFPGLVIRYAYLWRAEFLAGMEEGRKDRPCAIIASIRDDDGETRVLVLPVTHRPPERDESAVEIPAKVKARLGLDGARSWVIVSEWNEFTWPGPDLRPKPGKGEDSIAYGALPPGLFGIIRERFLAQVAARSARRVRRTDK